MQDREEVLPPAGMSRMQAALWLKREEARALKAALVDQVFSHCTAGRIHANHALLQRFYVC